MTKAEARDELLAEAAANPFGLVSRPARSLFPTQVEDDTRWLREAFGELVSEVELVCLCCTEDDVVFQLTANHPLLGPERRLAIA